MTDDCHDIARCTLLEDLSRLDGVDESEFVQSDFNV